MKVSVAKILMWNAWLLRLKNSFPLKHDVIIPAFLCKYSLISFIITGYNNDFLLDWNQEIDKKKNQSTIMNGKQCVQVIITNEAIARVFKEKWNNVIPFVKKFSGWEEFQLLSCLCHWAAHISCYWSLSPAGTEACRAVTAVMKAVNTCSSPHHATALKQMFRLSNISHNPVLYQPYTQGQRKIINFCFQGTRYMKIKLNLL